MRPVKLAITTLILLFATILANSFYIHHKTRDFAKMVESVNTDDMEKTADEFEAIFKKFRKTERFISITVSHDDLTNIEESFADIIGAAKGGMKSDVITIKSRLKDELLHLGRLSSINLDSII